MLTITEYPLEGEMGENKPYVRAYLQDPPLGLMAEPDRKYPAMVVFPGGGYRNLSPREGEPIAMQYAAKGFQTFVVYYTLLPVTYPQPLIDAAKAMTWIRDHAEEWHIAPDQIAVCGFSAGGHLCAALSTFWNGKILEEYGLAGEKVRPDAAVLCYTPVEAKNGRDDFGRRFLGEHYEDPEYAKIANIPEYVTEKNPPAFFFHTFADEKVPVTNCLSMASAMAKHGVPFELHVYPRGMHGLALSNCQTWFGHDAMLIPEAAEWVDLSARWLADLMGFRL